MLASTVTLRQCETCIRDVDEKLRVPETFYMLLDMDRGTLAFQVVSEQFCYFGIGVQVNNDFLGVAFSGLRGEELFPIVSAVWGHCEVVFLPFFWTVFLVTEVDPPLTLHWQVTLTYINGHHFDRESSPS